MAIQPLKLSSPSVIEFTVYCHPEPQGSKNAFVIPGTNRAVVVDVGAKKLKPFRQEVTRTAIAHVSVRPWAGKHVPVSLTLTFCLLRPPSAAKRRYPVVKPDCDKLARSVFDALTGVVFADDAQVVRTTIEKVYAIDECVRIRAEIL